jgi:hypothetical protein
MTPEERQRLEAVESIIASLVRSDRFVFEKHLQLLDGKNIQLATGTGTKIGTATTQKLAFYGVTPVDQPATVADPTGGATTDAEARTAIVAIIDRLQETGLIA